MPSQHKHRPVSFRPAESDRNWLAAHARATARPVNAVLRQALAEYRRNHDQDEAGRRSTDERDNG